MAALDGLVVTPLARLAMIATLAARDALVGLGLTLMAAAEAMTTLVAPGSAPTRTAAVAPRAGHMVPETRPTVTVVPQVVPQVALPVAMGRIAHWASSWRRLVML